MATIQRWAKRHEKRGDQRFDVHQKRLEQIAEKRAPMIDPIEAAEYGAT